MHQFSSFSQNNYIQIFSYHVAFDLNEITYQGLAETIVILVVKDVAASRVALDAWSSENDSVEANFDNKYFNF